MSNTPFNFSNKTAATTQDVVTGWFINTQLDLGGVMYTPRENLSLQSDKSKGAWDKLLTRIVDTQMWDKVAVTVTSVNIDQKFLQQDMVDDAELDALLNQGELATPLFEKKAKVPKAPVFAYINCEISSPYIKGVYKASIRVRKDVSKAVLSKLLGLSKIDKLDVPVRVTQVLNPRIVVEYELSELDF